MMKRPSLDAWLDEAYECDITGKTGMYLFHNGVVRKTTKDDSNGEVVEMQLSVDRKKVDDVLSDSKKLKGITYIKIWIQEGTVKQGESIVLILIGGDIRPNVTKGLEYVIHRLKNECIQEMEIVA